MGIVAGEIAAARRALLNDAAKRWLKRQQERDAGLGKVEQFGPGAADPPLRQMQFAVRQANKARLGVPSFAERVIGTRDFTAFSPSVLATAAAGTVARITDLPGANHEAQGLATGILLPGGLLLTNYHVFPSGTYAVECAANFGYARDDRGINAGSYFELDPTGFFHANETFDFALVAVKATGMKGESLDALGATQLIEATGKVLVGMGLNIVQHPQGGPRQFAVRNNRLLDILGEGYLHYETDTEPGSSGSKVTNTDWELVALHHSGVPRMKDGRILRTDGSTWNEQRDGEDSIAWVANEGIRVSRIVDELKRVQLGDARMQARLDGLLAAAADPFEAAGLAGLAGLTTAATAATVPTAVPPLAVPASLALPGSTAMSAGQVFNFSGPVTLHVYAPATGGPAVAAEPPAPAVVPDAAPVGDEKTLVFDGDYAARRGYDPKFLGVRIGLPKVVEARQNELYTVADYRQFFDEYRNVPELDLTGLAATSPLELKYHHYSLVLNKPLRMCMWTASNCDYRSAQRQDRRKRSELGGENWRADPRVPQALQLLNDDVYGPGRRIDRGHIVRREDNCWGAAGLPTDYANADTYHYTNCTPQHEAFNQENPSNKQDASLYKNGQKGIWGQFEGDLAQAIEDGGGQAVLFAGPVLSDLFDPVTVAGQAIRIPKKFWKVVVVMDGPKKTANLKAYGYLFSQSDVVKKYGFGFEGVALPAFDRQRISLAELAALTGVQLAPNVVAAEQPMP